MTRRTRIWVLGLALGVFLGAAGLALAISPCELICPSWCDTFCSFPYMCMATELCIDGVGYCQFTCTDGTVKYVACEKDCPKGGGSPVFKKKPTVPDPWE